MTQPNQVQIENRRQFIWITLPRELNMDNCQDIEKQIIERLQIKNPKVVIDCCNIQYVYSSGIGLLIRIRNFIVKNEGSFWLVNVSKACRENFLSLRLEKILSIFATDVEFELSQNEIWEEELSKDTIPFLCICQLENTVYRITLVGKMIAVNDLSAFRNICYIESISKYVFDLTGLEMLDSQGIYLFLECINTLQKHNVKCSAFGVNSIIRELFNLCGIDELIMLCENESSALQILQ